MPPGLDMVVVVTVDPLFGDHGGSSRSLEKANLNFFADFVAGLPPTCHRETVKSRKGPSKHE